VMVCVAPVARLVSTIWAPGIADPEESATVPEMEPEADWADTGEPVSIAAKQRKNPSARTTQDRPNDFFMTLTPPRKKLATPDRLTQASWSVPIAQNFARGAGRWLELQKSGLDLRPQHTAQELSPHIQSIDFLDATPAGKHLASSVVFCQDKNIDFLKTFARKLQMSYDASVFRSSMPQGRRALRRGRAEPISSFVFQIKIACFLNKSLETAECRAMARSRTAKNCV